LGSLILLKTTPVFCVSPDGKQMATLKKIMFMLERFVMVFHTGREPSLYLMEESMSGNSRTASGTDREPPLTLMEQSMPGSGRTTRCTVREPSLFLMEQSRPY